MVSGVDLLGSIASTRTPSTGYNSGLKLLERVSRYHRQHGERSFRARRLDPWVSGLGGAVTARKFVGFVPMFSPDGYARTAKLVEPTLERLPLRQIACAQAAQRG